MPDSTRRGPFYLAMTLAMSATAFTGFSFTYFGPTLRGQYPEASPLVHLHGWSFFAWYLLLPLQAGLIRSNRRAVHRTLGMASLALAVIMVATGLVVIGVQVNLAMSPDGSPFWRRWGPGVFSTLLVFAIFYGAAVRNRRRAAYHKRYIIAASAGALGAAVFRILGTLLGFASWIGPVGILLTTLFIVVAMLGDLRREGTVHPAYRLALPVVAGLQATMLFLLPAGGHDPVRASLAWIGRLAAPLY